MFANLGITGKYTISADGRSTATLFSSLNPINIDFVLVSGQHALVIRFDNDATASGTMDPQDSSVLPILPHWRVSQHQRPNPAWHLGQAPGEDGRTLKGPGLVVPRAVEQVGNSPRHDDGAFDDGQREWFLNSRHDHRTQRLRLLPSADS